MRLRMETMYMYLASGWYIYIAKEKRKRYYRCTCAGRMATDHAIHDGVK